MQTNSFIQFATYSVINTLKLISATFLRFKYTGVIKRKLNCVTFVKNKRLRNMGMKISLKVLRQRTEKHCRKLQRKTVTQEHRGSIPGEF